MEDKKRQDYQTLRNVYKKALDIRLSEDDIAGLTIYGRCQVISDLVSALKVKTPQARHGSAGHVRDSLLMIAKSFEPSDYLLGEQYRRRNFFLRQMQDPKNAHILETIRQWDAIDQDQRNFAVE